MIDILRLEMKPKDLVLAPDELYIQEVLKDITEWTVLRAWVKQWLKYVKWYSSVALSPEVTINQLFHAPIVTSTWKRTKRDENLVRFGLLWKLYDIVAVRGVEWTCPILSSTINSTLPVEYGFWLFGGYSGTSFLVSSFGLNHPKAGKGVISYGGDPKQTITYKTKLTDEHQPVYQEQRAHLTVRIHSLDVSPVGQ